MQEEDKDYNLKYFLAILNSKLLTFYAINRGLIRNLGTGSPQIRLKDIRNLNFPSIEKVNQQPLILIVDQILAIKKSDPTANTSTLETEIDQLVYKLYDLSPEEIEIVEGK